MPKEKDLCQISLKLLLKNTNGEILALRAVPHGSYAGFYDLPGGRIDIDEFKTDLADTIAREVTEELGEAKYKLKPGIVAAGRHIIPPYLTKTGKETHVLYLFFEAKYLGGEIKTSAEHTGFAWLDLKKIEPAKYFTSGILEGVRMYLDK
jgi:8-oxo-dGTP pyrophosphatase MutT (NUDIX family)